MNKLGAGVILIALGGFLECARYISAAVYMSGMPSQSRELFADGLSYVGSRLMILAGIAAFAGVVLAAAGLWESYQKKKR